MMSERAEELAAHEDNGRWHEESQHVVRIRCGWIERVGYASREQVIKIRRQEYDQKRVCAADLSRDAYEAVSHFLAAERARECQCHHSEHGRGRKDFGRT